MKKSYFLFFIMLSIACNSTENNDHSAVDSLPIDSSMITDSTKTVADDTIATPDSALRELNEAILKSVKNKDYPALEAYIHPQLGLRLSPYAHVNMEDIIIAKSDFSKTAKSAHKSLWGHFDGTGEPIELSLEDYFSKFVYDVDFLNAEKVSINTSASSGNIINNIHSVYADADYVENYFSGFDPQFQGMDWRALRLVFKKENSQYFLIAIVHDQWTT